MHSAIFNVGMVDFDCIIDFNSGLHSLQKERIILQQGINLFMKGRMCAVKIAAKSSPQYF